MDKLKTFRVSFQDVHFGDGMTPPDGKERIIIYVRAIDEWNAEHSADKQVKPYSKRLHGSCDMCGSYVSVWCNEQIPASVNAEIADDLSDIDNHVINMLTANE